MHIRTLIFIIFSLCVSDSIAQEQTVDDFIYKLNSCERIRTTLTCSLTVRNIGILQKLSLAYYRSYIIDNFGTELEASSIAFSDTGLNEKQLVTNVPVNINVVFDGISPQVQFLARLRVGAGQGVQFDNVSFTDSLAKTQYSGVVREFLYELKGCNKLQTTITCSLQVTNKAATKDLSLGGGELVDNLGNEFRTYKRYYGTTEKSSQPLLTGVPVGVTYVFEDISSDITEIPRLIVNKRAFTGVVFRHVLFTNPQPVTDYDVGKQVGRNECIANPVSCGISTSSVTNSVGANKLTGLSTRGYIDTNAENALIAGITVESTSKKLLIRASSVDGVLNPQFEIRTFPDATLIHRNNDWISDPTINELQVTNNAPSRITDAATIIRLSSGLYTITVSPEDKAGIGMIEVYELD
ncbi:hypothetical protein [Candidatus Albibeggiatoa sp. nov. NOAA]|uniref:hypothetical protein n=1 Tax=Candidatus Albibeggiatoa sp. nov. NOAA TaxID=3162724 RepID=UPI0032FB6894|nr:hypothetical protein [Thiotrichaceae bacterium]